MKIYILCDMEGISGIRRVEQVQPDKPDFAEGRVLMARDINAAAAGAFAGGATQVIVGDAHFQGQNIRIDDLDPRLILESPGGGRMMPSLDESFAGVMLLGHHARAGTINGFLDHTMSSMNWFEYRINDVIVGEIGIEAAWAGQYGVPVIMVSGDEATAAEAVQTLGAVETAVVKRGVGRQQASCLPLETAHSVITAAADRATRQARSYRPYVPSLPATIELTVYRSDMADGLATQTGTVRVDARTVRRTISHLAEVCRW